jgi:hypothetical protein
MFVSVFSLCGLISYYLLTGDFNTNETKKKTNDKSGQIRLNNLKQPRTALRATIFISLAILNPTQPKSKLTQSKFFYQPKSLQTFFSFFLGSVFNESSELMKIELILTP